MTKSRPVLLVAAFLVVLQTFTATAGLTDIISKDAMALIVGGIAALQAGLAFYVQGVVVPLKDTAAYKDKAGEIVTGPAAPPEGEPAEVVTDDALVPAENVDPLYAEGP